MVSFFLKLSKKVLKKFGYSISRTEQINLDDIEDDFWEIYNKCKDFTMTSKEKMYALYKSVEYIIDAQIPGDFVECGVWRGGSIMLIAYTLLKKNDISRKIYLYDTFEGMTQPTSRDRSIKLSSKNILKFWEKKSKKKEGWCYASLDEVKDNIKICGYPFDNFVFVKGKVEETLSKKKPNIISLLRLDTDWYESTKFEMYNLFPILEKRGVLILDDYGHWEGSREAVDEYIKHNKVCILLSRISSGGRIGVKI